VLQEGDEEMTSVGALVTNLSGELLVDLAGGEGITPRARRDWPRLTATTGRYIVSLVVRREALPEPLPKEAFLLPPASHRPDPRRPAVRLQRFDDAVSRRHSSVSDASSLPAEQGATSGNSLLVAEALLPVRGALTLLEARDAVIATVREHLPFLDEHSVIVDSPHDGLPLRDSSGDRVREIDRIHLGDSSPGPEPMQWQWTVDPPGWHDLAGEPFRGPIPGTHLVGPTVLPALGQEGELLAACSVVREITRRNSSRQKMRRQMWTRIETG
jgi:hypothetical protein